MMGSPEIKLILAVSDRRGRLRIRRGAFLSKQPGTQWLSICLAPIGAGAWLQVTIYLSAYVEAANRDAFMAVKQDLLLAFVDCCNRNGARLSRKRTQVRPNVTNCFL